jgi:hypothetical protein
MKDLTSKTSDIIPQEIIENKILLIRGKKVMLDKEILVPWLGYKPLRIIWTP